MLSDDTGKLHRLLVDGLQQLQRWLDLCLWFTGFHRGADDGDVFPLGRHVVSIRDHADVDVWIGKAIVTHREKEVN